MTSRKLSRKTFLRGIGGFAIALPALEIMAPARATAGPSGAPPKRFLISYGGVSTGSTYDHDLMTPDTVGFDYDLKRAIASLGDLGVANEVSVVSGLKLPWGDANALPPGGRTINYHYNTVGPMVSGMSGPDAYGIPKGPTADQIVADAIGGDTLHHVLTHRIQAASYISVNGSGNQFSGASMTLSWRKDGSGLVAVEPTFSPRLAYESLFTGFVPTDPEEAKKAQLLLENRKSVIDLVHWNIERLIPKLGAADKQRMERHFDEIRSLETRLDAIHTMGGSCQLPPDPGEDPPIAPPGIDHISCDNVKFDPSAGYSNEDLRGDILTDLIRMAFACDLSRSASLLMTEWKSYMNMNEITGVPADLHTYTHDGNLDAQSDSVNWHVKQLGRLVKKLRDTPEVDGTTLLDHTAAVLLFEGGYGYDPEGGTNPSPHSTENMVVLIGGRAGGLKPGQHVLGAERHPASVVVSAMNAVGVEGGLGEITDGIPELFG